MELSCLKITKLLIFRKMEISSPEKTLRARKIKKNILKKFIVFQKMELSSSKLRKLLYFF